jgi:hypothetical protein
MNTLVIVLSVIVFIGICFFLIFSRYDFINPNKKPSWYDPYMDYHKKEKEKEKKLRNDRKGSTQK